MLDTSSIHSWKIANMLNKPALRRHAQRIFHLLLEDNRHALQAGLMPPRSIATSLCLYHSTPNWSTWVPHPDLSAVSLQAGLQPPRSIFNFIVLLLLDRC